MDHVRVGVRLASDAVILIGGILAGVFTATEAAAVASVWAIVLSTVIYRSIGIAALARIFRLATRDSAIIMFILACSALFGWVLTRTRTPDRIAEWLSGLSADPRVLTLLIIAFLLVVGCFTAVVVSINILTPILVPVAVAIGFDPVHFGVVMIMTLVIGEVTPPFGMVLFVLTRISGRSFAFVVSSAIPWILTILVVVLIVAAFPAIALWLPDLVHR